MGNCTVRSKQECCSSLQQHYYRAVNICNMRCIRYKKHVRIDRCSQHNLTLKTTSAYYAVHGTELAHACGASTARQVYEHLNDLPASCASWPSLLVCLCTCAESAVVLHDEGSLDGVMAVDVNWEKYDRGFLRGIESRFE